MIFFYRGSLTEIGAEIVLHLTNNQLNYSEGSNYSEKYGRGREQLAVKDAPVPL